VIRWQAGSDSGVKKIDLIDHLADTTQLSVYGQNKVYNSIGLLVAFKSNVI
jgi:hypothetical protein